MEGAVDPREELRALRERFGPDTALVFEGPAGECPVCTGALDQLSLLLDLAGWEPAACPSCGALVAA